MMHPSDTLYSTLAGAVGTVARAVRRGLPPGWRLRLEAEGPAGMRPGWIWVHAVSVGELLLSEGLVGKLLEEGRQVHLTTGTPAGITLMESRLPGLDRGRGLLGGGAFPLDDHRGLRPFFRVPPGAFVALETELWPGLLRELERRGIPRIVVNGRLTSRTVGRAGPWLRNAAARLSLVAARDPESLEAFRRLGAPRVELGGNLKSDLPPPKRLGGWWDRLRAAWREDPVLVAGSTLEGEEPLVLEAWAQARETRPSLRLILAPRQPRRFDAVAGWLDSGGWIHLRASRAEDAGGEGWRAPDILLLDTLGDLPSAYGEGTAALVGGGWNGTGGHNPMEPVRWGIPTLLGPGFSNFQDMVAPLEKAGLVRIVEAPTLGAILSDVLSEAALRGPGLASGTPLPEELRGALEKTWRLIQPFLPALG